MLSPMRRLGLPGWILLAMLAGIVIGAAWPHTGIALQPLEVIFLRLIKVIVGPLIFATLVSGIAGHGDMRGVGRIGLKAIIYFEVATTLALVLGLAAAHLFHPGRGVALAPATGVEASVSPAAPVSLMDNLILHAVPQSFADALARGEVLQVVVFSLLLGLAIIAAGESGKPLLRFCQSLAQVMFRFTNMVMWFAPLGVLGALAAGVGREGVGVLWPLLRLVGTLYLTLVLFLTVLVCAVMLLFRIPARRFLLAVREPVMIAFSTASSEAALPRAIEEMETLGVSARIAGFVIPAGYSFNLDGSTLYLSLAALFIAQLAGLHLGLERELLLMLTLMLTSKGVAGVARGAIVVLAGAAGTFGLPLAGVALVLGVDQFLDMGRTAVNVFGNCLAAAAVARWEGESLDVRGMARVAHD